jgi:mannosyltransferase OCH1-like enzyme
MTRNNQSNRHFDVQIDKCIQTTQTSGCTKVPKIIFQTYHQPNKIPAKVKNNFELFALGYERRVYDDRQAIEFLLQNFTVSVALKFIHLKRGAHKADLLRYCLLYVYGGIYMDIKTELVRPIDGMFRDNTITTCLTYRKGRMYQGIIGAPSRQVIFLDLINMILGHGNSPVYLKYVRDFYRYIKNDAGEVKEGYLRGKFHNYMIFTEVVTSNANDCSDGLDRYHVCSNIRLNNETIIKTRYSDYPWE